MECLESSLSSKSMLSHDLESYHKKLNKLPWWFLIYLFFLQVLIFLSGPSFSRPIFSTSLNLFKH